MGAGEATITDAVAEAFAAPGLAGIFIAPSNPILGIAPILTVPGMRELIRSAGVPVPAVSPFVDGRPVKGLLSKLFAEIGIASCDAGFFGFYEGLADRFVAHSFEGTLGSGTKVFRTDLLMRGREGRRRLAGVCLDAIRAAA